MNFTVKARHMEVTDAMRQYLEPKVAKLPRYYDNIQSVEVTLDVEADQAVVEILVSASRKSTFVATDRQEDLYACMDECLRKIAEQLRRHKDRVRDRQADPLNQTSEGAER